MTTPTMRWERLRSMVRTLQAETMELKKAVGVLNRKVELIHDKQTETSFLKEEDLYENATHRVAPRSVHEMPQTDAKT